MKKLLLVPLLALSGCGVGVSPELYQLVVDYFSAPTSCYTNPPTQVVTQAGPMSVQVQVWDGPDNKAWLEMEGAARQVDMGSAPDVTLGGVLEGTAGSSGWTFAVDRAATITAPVTGTVTTDTHRIALVMPRTATFKGTLSVSSSRTCTGTGCPASNPSCSIDGVVVRGTRLQVDYQRAP